MINIDSHGFTNPIARDGSKYTLPCRHPRRIRKLCHQKCTTPRFSFFQNVRTPAFGNTCEIMKLNNQEIRTSLGKFKMELPKSEIHANNLFWDHSNHSLIHYHLRGGRCDLRRTSLQPQTFSFSPASFWVGMRRPHKVPIPHTSGLHLARCQLAGIYSVRCQVLALDFETNSAQLQ